MPKTEKGRRMLRDTKLILDANTLLLTLIYSLDLDLYVVATKAQVLECM